MGAPRVAFRFFQGFIGKLKVLVKGSSKVLLRVLQSLHWEIKASWPSNRFLEKVSD